ncbi:hypothetical protein GD604_14970 [Desulfolutivibrio sulfoxidireducens]|nr:hypothetical protein GD604_14970 [Desulfolutivibrio sulfoxidireducens]
MKNVGLGVNGGGVVKQFAGLNGEFENQGGESGDFRIERRELRLHSGRFGFGWRILLKERLLAQDGGDAYKKDESPGLCTPRAFP